MGNPKGQFRCAPTPCQACALAGIEIQQKGIETWEEELQRLPEPVRNCVAEYLRGIRVRQAVAERLQQEARRRAPGPGTSSGYRSR